MFKKIVILSVFLFLNSYAAPKVWKDGEFLFWSYGKRFVSPADFCFALRYENEKIGTPHCYEAGDWERDTTASLYAKWLDANLDSRLQSEDLRPRNPHVIDRLRNLKDKNLLFSTIKGDKLWFLLFDESSSEPIRIATFPVYQDSAKIIGKIASDWFGGTPQRRLSDSERAAKQMEPDEYFAEQPMHDFWLGIGAGWTRAINRPNSRIKNYRDVPDSASVWNFIEDSSPFYSAYIGGSLYDFIGLEFEFHRSEHKAKIDKSESQKDVYEELLHWNFNRYEFLLSLIFMTVFKPHPQIEIEPYSSVSIIYSIFTEDIARKDGEPSQPYRDRFEFESYYRGIALNFGLRTAFFKNYALNLRTGIANRGTSMVTQEIIGSSTTDAYIAAGLEYHFRWK
jgi:hypothetical protein